jgi:tetratricopeptide (TPR) repeat protein
MRGGADGRGVDPDLSIPATDARNASRATDAGRRLAKRREIAGQRLNARRRDYIAALSEHANALARAGNLSKACRTYRNAYALARKQAALCPSDPNRLLDASVISQSMSQVLIAQGDVAAAASTVRQELDWRRRLAAAEQNEERRRDVANALKRLGDLLVLQSNLAGIRRALDIGGTGLRDRRQIGQVLDQMRAAGASFEAGGHHGSALAVYREQVAMLRLLSARDPDDLASLFDLAWALVMLARAHAAHRDFLPALAAFSEALDLRRALLARDPENPARQLDLSWTLMAAGGALEEKGDLASALAKYRESLALRQELAAADPENDGLQCDLAVVLIKIGDVLKATGDSVQTLEAYREALAIAGLLSERKWDTPQWQNELSMLKASIETLAREAREHPG